MFAPLHPPYSSNSHILQPDKYKDSVNHKTLPQFYIMRCGQADGTVISDSFSPGLDPSTTLSSRLAAAEAQHKRAFQCIQIAWDPSIPSAVHRRNDHSSLDHESDGTLTQSSQPVKNDVGHDDSHETNNTADGAGHETAAATSRGKDSSTAVTASEAQTEADNDDLLPMLKQLETRLVSQEQLLAEVKAIYAGLVMVENKCRTLYVPTSLNDEQYEALFYLFRVLIQEHHDFFLASQHCVASPALRNLAKKYNMAARMWRYGIYAFLELLRIRLPESQEFLDAFIHWSYSMMSLLDETVPQFRSFWVEFKGDIARYRYVGVITPQCYRYMHCKILISAADGPFSRVAQKSAGSLLPRSSTLGL